MFDWQILYRNTKYKFKKKVFVSKMIFVLILLICQGHSFLNVYRLKVWSLFFRERKSRLKSNFSTFTQKRKFIQASNWVLPRFFIFCVYLFFMGFYCCKISHVGKISSWQNGVNNLNDFRFTKSWGYRNFAPKNPGTFYIYWKTCTLFGVTPKTCS